MKQAVTYKYIKSFSSVDMLMIWTAVDHRETATTLQLYHTNINRNSRAISLAQACWPKRPLRDSRNYLSLWKTLHYYPHTTRLDEVIT